MPNLYVISGCNGAGKTTCSYTVLPEMFSCSEFVNADEIAKGLSPFNPDSVQFEAGRIMLKRIRQLIEEQVDFALETTLSSRSYQGIIQEAKKAGYSINIIFIWLNSVDLAIQRVESRVLAGGHDIPVEIIRRRYKRGLNNFKRIFLSLCDYWLLVDNSDEFPILISDYIQGQSERIYNSILHQKIFEND